jgi:hypothetical protein
LLFVLASNLPRAGPRGRSLLSSVWTRLPGPSVRSYGFSGLAAKTLSRAHRRAAAFFVHFGLRISPPPKDFAGPELARFFGILAAPAGDSADE